MLVVISDLTTRLFLVTTCARRFWPTAVGCFTCSSCETKYRSHTQIPTQLRAWDVQWSKHLIAGCGQHILDRRSLEWHAWFTLIYTHVCIQCILTHQWATVDNYALPWQRSSLAFNMTHEHDTCITMGPRWTVKAICWGFLLVTEHLGGCLLNTHKGAHAQHTHTQAHTRKQTQLHTQYMYIHFIASENIAIAITCRGHRNWLLLKINLCGNWNARICNRQHHLHKRLHVLEAVKNRRSCESDLV